jgi:hypothetical protein
MGKKGRKDRSRRQGRHSSRVQMNVAAEASHIQGLAAQHESRVVTLGPLVFFSTESGDAWVLDPGDRLARRLAQDGDPLPSRIIETPKRLTIEWDMTYRIVGNAFICVDSEGRERVIVGSPVAAILRASGA